jgi:hypothetical protein
MRVAFPRQDGLDDRQSGETGDIGDEGEFLSKPDGSREPSFDPLRQL